MSAMLPAGSVAGVGVIALLTTISWGLAHLAKRLPAWIPRWTKIAVCGTLVQLAMGTVGYLLYVEVGFLEWVTTRPTRAYILVPGTLILGCLAAWSVLRDRGREIDVGVFD